MRSIFIALGAIVLPGSMMSVSPVHAGTLGCAARSSPTIVLGSRAYYAPQSRGWGSVKPRTIYNGGDPAGLVTNIRWQHWGQKSAIGWGFTSIFKPAGGYYPRLVRAELRATDIGRCTAGGQLAYRRLSARVPSRPGGPLGAWFRWSGTGNICHSP
jgi:hypothetical protein